MQILGGLLCFLHYNGSEYLRRRLFPGLVSIHGNLSLLGRRRRRPSSCFGSSCSLDIPPESHSNGPISANLHGLLGPFLAPTFTALHWTALDAHSRPNSSAVGTFLTSCCASQFFAVCRYQLRFWALNCCPYLCLKNRKGLNEGKKDKWVRSRRTCFMCGKKRKNNDRTKI